MILSYSKWKNIEDIKLDDLIYQACIILHLVNDTSFKILYGQFIDGKAEMLDLKYLLDLVSLNKKIVVKNFNIQKIKTTERLNSYKDIIEYTLPAAEEIFKEFNDIDVIEWIYPEKGDLSIEDFFIVNSKNKIGIKIDLNEDVDFSVQFKKWTKWDTFIKSSSNELNLLTLEWVRFFINNCNREALEVLNNENINNIKWHNYKDYKFNKTFGYYLPVFREKHFLLLPDLLHTNFTHLIKAKQKEWFTYEEDVFSKLLVKFTKKDIQWDKFLKSILLVSNTNVWVLKNHGLYFNKNFNIQDWLNLSITYNYYLEKNQLYIKFSTGHEIVISIEWENFICGNLDIKIILK